MDAGEEMASPEDYRISIADNGSESGESIGPGPGPGPGINEEDKPDLDEWITEVENKKTREWITEVENKMARAFNDLILLASPLVSKGEPKICKLTVRERISQPRLDTEGGLSQPRTVTIGPFHRKEHTTISDDKKWVIVRLTNMLHNLNVGRSLLKMKNQVANAYKHYYFDCDLSESSDLKDHKSFAEMLLLDSYFILFLLTIKIRKGLIGYTLMPVTPKFAEPLKLSQDEPHKFLDIMFHKDEIALDLLIFDNQIPFFVIEELFGELKLDKPLHEYALEFFETIHPRSAQHCIDENSPPKFLHLLDLFHWSRVPNNKYIELTSSSPQQRDSIDRPCHIPNAMELRESATRFEKKTSDSSLDITFQRRRFKRIIRVLDIPLLHILDYSSLVFYNLIVFEIQSLTRGRCAMAFSALMRNLLRSEEDVRLLRQNGILVSSSLNDKQLIDLFARLSRLTENHQMPSDLFDICNQVLSHHDRPVSQFYGVIILQYFPNPVVTLSMFVAALLFVPTILQTIYAMIYHS